MQLPNPVSFMLLCYSLSMCLITIVTLACNICAHKIVGLVRQSYEYCVFVWRTGDSYCYTSYLLAGGQLVLLT